MASTTLIILATLVFTPGPVRNAPAQDNLAVGNKTKTAARLQFDSEFISIYIEEDSLRVDGFYRFLHPSQEAPTTLFYPYPEDSLLGGARMVSLEARAPRGPWQPVGYVDIPRRWSARWQVPPCHADTLEVKAVYRQALLSSYARYIVTSVHGWDRPIKHAVFEIHLPEGAKPMDFSFPFEACEQAGGNLFRYEATDFLPDRDVTVTWEKEE